MRILSVGNNNSIPRSPRQNLSVPKGFTLIELLVALAIIGLSTMLVPPMLNNALAGAKVKSAARELVAVLRSSRDHAILTNRETVLQIDVDKASYLDYKRSTPAKLDLPGNTRLVLTTSRTEQTSRSEASIRFYPDGSSTGGRIELHSGSDQYQLDINWLTGNIRLIP